MDIRTPFNLSEQKTVSHHNKLFVT